jgi:hypothetical protein
MCCCQYVATGAEESSGTGHNTVRAVQEQIAYAVISAAGGPVIA